MQLNAQRTQFFLTYTSALLAAGAGLLSLDGVGARALTAAVFLIGAFASVVCAKAHRLQHEYYRRARDRLRSVEALVAPGPPAWDTTTVGGGGSHTGVTGLVTALLVSLGLLHGAGAGVAIFLLVSQGLS